MSQQIPIGFLSTYHARRDPARPMLTQGDRTLSRAEFDASSNRFARALAALGIGQDDAVAMLLPNCPAVFELSVGLWKIGATPAPLSLSLPAVELGPILALMQPKLVICDDPARVQGYPAVALSQLLDPTISAEPVPECAPKYWRLATSGGSTGRPKVIIDRRSTLGDPNEPALGLKVDGVMLNPGPLYHSGPFSISHSAMFVGNHVVSMPKFDALGVLELIERRRVDWLYLVPTMMNRIWRLPEADRLRPDLSSLQVAFHMASACPIWLKEKWIEWLGPERIWELYSGSESIASTIITGKEWLKRKGSVGRVAGAADCSVLRPDGTPCEPGEVGEVVFRNHKGIGATYHYLGTEPRRLAGWESIGDLGYLDEDGYLYIVDRRTDMIVSGGANVYTAEVEAAIEAHEDVECCVVVGLPDGDLVHRVHAIVQPAPRAELSPEALRAFLKGRLVGYKVPRTFEFTEGPLRDSAGKVRRTALRDERIGVTPQVPAVADAISTN